MKTLQFVTTAAIINKVKDKAHIRAYIHRVGNAKKSKEDVSTHVSYILNTGKKRREEDLPLEFNILVNCSC